jgi:hypothetical protein
VSDRMTGQTMSSDNTGCRGTHRKSRPSSHRANRARASLTRRISTLLSLPLRLPTWHHLETMPSAEVPLVRARSHTLRILWENTRINGNDALQDPGKRPNFVLGRRPKVLPPRRKPQAGNQAEY